MKILIVGGGGREHALAWKISNIPYIKKVYVAPGNAGTHLENKVTNIDIQVNDIYNLKNFAKRNEIDLTIIGSETPLVLGIVDSFFKEGLLCFGPTQRAAQLEGSKGFAKEFLKRHHIPTSDYKSFTGTIAAKEYVKGRSMPIVIKADGLASGKGVIIAKTEKEAFTAIDYMIIYNQFGEAGRRIIIEDFVVGEEVSFIVMTDGEHIIPLATSQDHKARDDGDKGPNTGGMGAYSPAPIVTPEIHTRILSEIVKPTLQGLITDGIKYTGFLYVGLIITEDKKFNVLEYNCRLGDPEAQSILMRLKSDIVKTCMASIEGTLHEEEFQWDDRAAVGVVLAAGGYPNDYRKYALIEGLPTIPNPDIKIFHAGTALKNNQVITTGGRVLCVTALGENIQKAKSKAYKQINTIYWPDIYFRTDIGSKK